MGGEHRERDDVGDALPVPPDLPPAARDQFARIVQLLTDRVIPKLDELERRVSDLEDRRDDPA